VESTEASGVDSGEIIYRVALFTILLEKPCSLGMGRVGERFDLLRGGERSLVNTPRLWARGSGRYPSGAGVWRLRLRAAESALLALPREFAER